MAAETAPYGRVTQKPSPVAEVHILWITAGLGCDGDSVSVTAATQPSIEDVLLGAIPGLPKVHLHNPVLAYENGDDFLKFWYMAEQGKLEPFVLVVEGSIPNEKIKKEGYWAALGTDPKTRTNGLTVWHPKLSRWLLAEPAPPTAAFMPWKAIPPARWVWLTTWVGTGNQKLACLSSMFPDARYNLTTSWKPCSICSTKWLDLRP